MASSGKGFGKFLGLISKKKTTKGPSKGGSDESDEDVGYMDPATIHSTEPPGGGRGPIPDYPPPRPPSPKTSPKFSRPHSSIEMFKNPPIAVSISKADHGKSLDSGSRKVKPRPPEKPPYRSRGPHNPGHDDYLDPWDSRRNPQAQNAVRKVSDDYSNPFDAKPTEREATRDYIEPWDSRREKPATVKKSPSPVRKIPYKEDYSDPWDSKVQGSVPKGSLEEDEDYSTPYDTGKDGVFEKIVARHSVRINNGSENIQQDDVYDMPYEEQLAAARAQAKSSPMIPRTQKQISLDLQQQRNQQNQHHTATRHHSSQSSDTYDEPWEYKQATMRGDRSPTVRNRVQTLPPGTKPSNGSVSSPPTDDYDAPWEWKENTVQKALNKRISTPVGPTKNINTDSGHPVPKARISTIPHSPPPAHNVSVSPPLESPKGYQVDPTIPLENQGWFHGPVTRTEAELLLRGQPDCSYLIRNSESKREDYSLSVNVTTFLLDKSGHECKNCMMASENQILADLISFVKQLGKRKILLVGKPGKPKKSNTFYFTESTADSCCRIDPPTSLGDGQQLVVALLTEQRNLLRTPHVLTHRNNNEPMHLKIANRNGKFILGLNSRPYDSIPEMIHHYSMNKLNIRGAEHVKLIYPIVQEAMYFTVEPGT